MAIDVRQEFHEKNNVLDTLIEQATYQLQIRQSPAGYWEDCFDTGVMPDAQTLISLNLLGVIDPEWTDPLLCRILSSQRADGSWGVYPEDHGDLSTTVECYYALQLYKKWPSEKIRKNASAFILRQGGLRKCRNLTKVFLALGGEIPWSWLPSPRIYALLFEDKSPVRIWDIVTFTRLHIAPMLLLSAMKYTLRTGESLQLGDFMFHTSSMDLQRQQCLFQKSWLNTSTLRQLFRCFKWMLDEREHDGSVAGYHSSTCLTAFTLHALGYDINHPELQAMLTSIRGNLVFDTSTNTAHQQTCNAHVWNTALALRALQAADVNQEATEICRAVNYLRQQQQCTFGTWVLKNTVPAGGWGFSSNNFKHPDNDDTIACLEALYPYRAAFIEDWWRGVDWLLGMQNHDGGWAAFEKNSTKHWLEWIPANDMRRTMSDPSTPDITGRAVAFLLKCEVLHAESPVMQKAIHWLHRHQEKNGSWFGRWGTTYIYGTWCAIQGLTAAMKRTPKAQSVYLQRAENWLLSIQHTDGSFAESCESDLLGNYVPRAEGVATQTAWALDAMLYLYEAQSMYVECGKLLKACQRAANWLQGQVDAQGCWLENIPTGSAFPGVLHIRYHIYPKIWPLMSLCHYRNVMTKCRERR